MVSALYQYWLRSAAAPVWSSTCAASHDAMTTSATTSGRSDEPNEHNGHHLRRCAREIRA